LRAQSPGGHAVRTGCLALGGVMLFLLAMSALDTAVLRKTRDLGLAWTDGHAQSWKDPTNTLSVCDWVASSHHEGWARVIP
jgi:hypothetical protein